MTIRQDPYCYPGTNILKNRGHYQTCDDLNAFEMEAVMLAFIELSEMPILLPFGSDRLKETHRRLLDCVYPWAGQFREHTGRMTKQRDGYMVTYGDDAHIVRELDKVFRSLNQAFNFQGLDRKTFAERTAQYYSDIDAIHPFREGNSRTLRPFFTDLARQAGYDLDWSKIVHQEDGRKNFYFARDMAVIQGDTKFLTSLIEMSLSSVQKMKTPQHIAVKRRLLVMKGQKILQFQQGSTPWQTESIDQAKMIKPGIYNLDHAHPADQAKIYEGIIVHIDARHVYQQVTHQLIQHDRQYFNQIPDLASCQRITYMSSIVQLQTIDLNKQQKRRKGRSHQL